MRDTLAAGLGCLLVVVAAGSLPRAVAGEGPSARSAAEAAAALADKVAEEAPDEGIWTWVERLEGEVLSEAAAEAIAEREAAEEAEQALQFDVPEPRVPTRFYADPEAALTQDPLRLDQVDPSEFDIPVVINEPVKKWMRYFLGSGRKHYRRYQARASTYRPLMYRELRNKGLPDDLVYLSMVESGYNAHAYSRVGAAGLWQFMPSTGRLYDLRVDWWVDDRRDPMKSTVAAVEHLGDLHEMFDGDWYLAWSAYNAGPGRVRRAMQRGGTRDFWKLAAAKHLPSETSNYVPKILAAAIIGKHPERYGFDDVEPKPELRYDEVPVEGSVDLEVLAECAGIDLERFNYLNPGLRRWATPSEGYAVRVPAGRGESFATALADIPVAKRVRFVQHRVATGETLGRIAARYGVDVASLVKANSLRNANRIVVGQQLVVPVAGGRESDGAVAEVATATDAPPPAEHTVRRGDTLSGIARQHGLSVAQLKQYNDLDHDMIRVGQVLSLQGGTDRSRTHTVQHTVQPGETLTAIAARFGVTVTQIVAWNDLTDPSMVRSGQRLTLRVPHGGWVSYTVRRGDSLGRIATRHQCSVADLKAWNGLTTSVIHPGQSLRIRD